MLLQSTLWSLLVYYMSMFTVPASMIVIMVFIRDFPWSKHDSNNEGFLLV